ncbi:hypothetical protein [Dokdonia sp.]|uniref:hypothetical protein n=1 Tax=Dokdonia sp. TaxID=2024995 RepID=UPI003263B072
MEVTLYNLKTLNENGRISFYRNVKTFVNDEGELIISCCDINNTAEVMFGDSGVEFYLTLDKENTNKVISEFGIINSKLVRQELLHKLESEFGGKDSCFEDVMEYLDTKNIDYQYDKW